MLLSLVLFVPNVLYFSDRSKIFIRFPKTLFATEDALETRKHDLGKSSAHVPFINNVVQEDINSEVITLLLSATKLQSGWKGYSQKSKYQKLRNAGEKCSCGWIIPYFKLLVSCNVCAVFSYCVRGLLEGHPGSAEGPAQATGSWHYSPVSSQSVRRMFVPAHLAIKLCSVNIIIFNLRFVKGFIYRHKGRCPENEYFLDYVRYSFLMNLHRNLPKNVLDKSWPTPPAALVEVLESALISKWTNTWGRAVVTNSVS